MRDARATEHRPLRLRDGTLIPDGERSDHARVTGSWQCTRDTHPYPLAGALDMIAGAPRERVHPDVGPRIADIAGGTKVSFEQPRLEIESGRIDTAVRPFQPHGQSPAFAGVNDRRRRSVAPSADKKRIAIARREPRKRDPFRNDGARRIDMLDRERKPHSLRGRLRQIVDDTANLYVALFPRRWKLVGQPDLRTPAGVREACETHRHNRHA